MPLPQIIRGLFPKFKPRSTNVGDLGEATGDCYGCWTIKRPVLLGGNEVGLCFNTGERPPGNAEIARYRKVAEMWPTVWLTIAATLRKELQDDGPGGQRDCFLKNARPVGLMFFGLNQWEVILEPDIYEGPSRHDDDEGNRVRQPAARWLNSRAKPSAREIQTDPLPLIREVRIRRTVAV